MATAQSTRTTGGLISTISSWLSKDSEETPLAKVVFSGTKITDGVYDLRPIGEQVEDFNVEIVFFHGLQLDPTKLDDAYFMTWVSDTEATKCWPATLLPKLFPKARLLSIKYDGTAAKKSNTSGRADFENVVENLVVDLIRNNRPFGAGVGQTRAPVIFVTHCLGGVFAQKLILEVDKQLLNRPDDLKLKNFWNNLGGIVYYSPPLFGSDEFVKATCSIKTKGPLLKFLEYLFAENARILQDFTDLLNSERLEPKPPSLVLADTTRDGFSGQVVQDSSRFGDNFLTVNGDYFSVCQPEDETSQSFQHLANFVQEAVKNFVSASARSRRGGAGSSPTRNQPEQSSTEGFTNLNVDERPQQDQRHMKNKVSYEDQLLSKVSGSGSGGSLQIASSKPETADKLQNDTGRKTISTQVSNESSELTFFKSYD